MEVRTLIGDIKEFIGSSELEKSYGKIKVLSNTGRYAYARIEADCGNEEFFYFRGNVIYYNKPVKITFKSCVDSDGVRYFKVLRLRNLDTDIC